MRSVVVAKYVPWPPNSGDKRRTLGIVRALHRLGDVTVCAFAGGDEDSAPLCAEGIGVTSVDRRRALVDLVAGMGRARSLSAARFWDPRLARIVREQAADADLLVVEHVQLLPYARGTSARRVLVDMHNIESSLTGRYARTLRGPIRPLLALEARALESLERRAMASADAVAVVSDTDRERLAAVTAGEGRAEVRVVPNAWDGVTPLPATRDATVCFVALMSWAPNVDAALWFTRTVWPLVTATVPEARLLLVGRSPTPAVRALASATVEVTGTVADVTTSYARSRLAVAPLRAGGGSRLKIMEALAHGRPVVATTIGAEGLDDLVGRGVVVADDAAAMAQQIVTLLGDDLACARLGAAGVAAVRTDHSWPAATAPLRELLSGWRLTTAPTVPREGSPAQAVVPGQPGSPEDAATGPTALDLTMASRR